VDKLLFFHVSGLRPDSLNVLSDKSVPVTGGFETRPHKFITYLTLRIYLKLSMSIIRSWAGNFGLSKFRAIKNHFSLDKGDADTQGFRAIPEVDQTFSQGVYVLNMKEYAVIKFGNL
jgi:hypothetical protein